MCLFPQTWTPFVGALRGLYPLGALLNHECTPNTRHAYDASGHMVIRAARAVAAGEELTVTYSALLWGSPARRQHLLRTKHFLCACSRCRDTTVGEGKWKNKKKKTTSGALRAALKSPPVFRLCNGFPAALNILRNRAARAWYSSPHPTPLCTVVVVLCPQKLPYLASREFYGVRSLEYHEITTAVRGMRVPCRGSRQPFLGGCSCFMREYVNASPF